MGWADREDAPTLIDMLGAEVRRLEADHADVTHHLDEIRICEVGDQVAAMSRERCGRLYDLVAALKAKMRP